MDARTQREADELAEEIATYADFIRKEHGDEQAQAFIERMVSRIENRSPVASDLDPIDELLSDLLN